MRNLQTDGRPRTENRGCKKVDPYRLKEAANGVGGTICSTWLSFVYMEVCGRVKQDFFILNSSTTENQMHASCMCVRKRAEFFLPLMVCWDCFCQRFMVTSCIQNVPRHQDKLITEKTCRHSQSAGVWACAFECHAERCMWRRHYQVINSIQKHTVIGYECINHPAKYTAGLDTGDQWKPVRSNVLDPYWLSLYGQNLRSWSNNFFLMKIAFFSPV